MCFRIKPLGSTQDDSSGGTGSQKSSFLSIQRRSSSIDISSSINVIRSPDEASSIFGVAISVNRLAKLLFYATEKRSIPYPLRSVSASSFVTICEYSINRKQPLRDWYISSIF